MASINFFIRNKKTTKDTPISVRVILSQNNEVVYSTGLKISPQNWDAKNQKVRNKIEVSNVKDLINNQLNKIKAFVEKTVTKLNIEEELTKDRLKEELDIFFKKSVAEKKIKTLYEYVDFLVEISKKRVLKVTWQTYKRTLELLKDFEKYEKYKISFKSINIEFYYLFIDYLENIEEMSVNTIGKQIKNVKMFMNTANDDGYTNYTGHKHKHFKVSKEESFQIYLEEKELTAIYKLEYDLNSVNDRVRDLFMIGAYTGQRISDWRKLNSDSIEVFDGVSCFKIKQSKTKAEVIIPLHPIVKDILNKRNGEAPKFVNEPDINLTIKKIARKAKIKEKIKEKGDKLKCELISSHTARRSFCTNAYKSGMDSLAIMQLSGHKTEKSFLTYIKISKQEFAVRIANHIFFN